jgi:hypothetical protein
VRNCAKAWRTGNVFRTWIHVVVQRPPARDLDARLDPQSPAEIRLGLGFEAAEARAPAVAKEEEVGLRRVALDEIVDAVVIEVGGGPQAR